MHILIIKFGALGDVVRTSYFAQSLHEKYGKDLKLSWLTSLAASPLISYNPFINDIWTSFDMASSYNYDLIYSLDDEDVIVDQVMKLNCTKIEGAIRNQTTHEITYTEKVGPWFDMGILSKHGRLIADELKISNQKSHAQIFSEIFDCGHPSPQLWVKSGQSLKQTSKSPLKKIGINSYAGGRWRSKELISAELEKLISLITNDHETFHSQDQIILLGANDDRLRNEEISQRIRDERILVPNTDSDILDLAEVIKDLDLLITSDSLAMHLAIAQKVPVIVFFAPTSAAEIDLYDRGEKIVSLSNDYCSYKSDADNSTITADRIFSKYLTLTKEWLTKNETI